MSNNIVQKFINAPLFFFYEGPFTIKTTFPFTEFLAIYFQFLNSWFSKTMKLCLFLRLWVNVYIPWWWEDRNQLIFNKKNTINLKRWKYFFSYFVFMVLRFELMPAKYCYNKKWYISSELGKQYNKHFTLKKSHL